jgi:hypothetical protein
MVKANETLIKSLLVQEAERTLCLEFRWGAKEDLKLQIRIQMER